jgi:hypothetical protein
MAVINNVSSRDMRIENKYVVKIPTHAGKEMLIYNHDGNYWMIDK